MKKFIKENGMFKYHYYNATEYKNFFVDNHRSGFGYFLFEHWRYDKTAYIFVGLFE